MPEGRTPDTFRKRSRVGNRRTFTVYIDENVAAQLDALVARGLFANRSQAVEFGIQRLIDDIEAGTFRSPYLGAVPSRPTSSA